MDAKWTSFGRLSAAFWIGLAVGVLLMKALDDGGPAVSVMEDPVRAAFREGFADEMAERDDAL